MRTTSVLAKRWGSSEKLTSKAENCSEWHETFLKQKNVLGNQKKIVLEIFHNAGRYTCEDIHGHTLKTRGTWNLNTRTQLEFVLYTKKAVQGKQKVTECFTKILHYVLCLRFHCCLTLLKGMYQSGLMNEKLPMSAVRHSSVMTVTVLMYMWDPMMSHTIFKSLRNPLRIGFIGLDAIFGRRCVVRGLSCLLFLAMVFCHMYKASRLLFGMTIVATTRYTRCSNGNTFLKWGNRRDWSSSFPLWCK